MLDNFLLNTLWCVYIEKRYKQKLSNIIVYRMNISVNNSIFHTHPKFNLYASDNDGNINIKKNLVLMVQKINAVL